MLEQTSAGVVITTRVVPRAGRSGIAGVRGDLLLVRLTAPPVDGAANAALGSLIASVIGVPRSAVEILSGQRSRTKRLLIRGTTLSRVAQALTAARTG